MGGRTPASVPSTASTAAWLQALRAAFIRLSGSARILLYAVPRAERPRRARSGPNAVEGSASWRDYLDARRRFDDGVLTLVVSLRQLEPEEGLLAATWGAAYANTFVLLEPHGRAIDLSDPTNPLRLRLQTEAPGGWPPVWLLAALEQTYGVWVSWAGGPAVAGRCLRRPLPLAAGFTPPIEQLRQSLRRLFPVECFRRALAVLLRDESELLRGHLIEHACSPFLTRVGLPLPADPSLVTSAVRALVNEGQLTARSSDGQLNYRGPQRPVPDELPQELFERLCL